MPAAPPLVFFGTPEFAVPTLDALAASGRMPALAVTQPSRPAGRGQRTVDSPVARWAGEHGVPLLQPERVREPGFLYELRSRVPGMEVAIVVAFGQIFPRALLELPRRGCINLHASLLPRYRGAAPIQAAIAAGETRTGVTTMQMEAGLDSGPILLQREVEIGEAETAGGLSPRLAGIGGELVVETLAGIERGEVSPRSQEHDLATYAPRLTRESGAVDWSLPAANLYCRLRAFTPWPGLTAGLRGRPVKLVWAVPDATPADAADAAGVAPGTYLGLAQGRARIVCGEGSVLAVESLQRPGKRSLSAADFANGERLTVGETFA